MKKVNSSSCSAIGKWESNVTCKLQYNHSVLKAELFENQNRTSIVAQILRESNID